MVRFILILGLLFALNVLAEEGEKSKIPELTKKLKTLDMENNPVYEDNFNQLVKLIESSLETEKQFCSGEVADPSGKVLGKEQKQLCFRELKTHYLEATDTIFNLKKKYLSLIHSRQLENLTQIQKKIRADIDKSF